MVNQSFDMRIYLDNCCFNRPFDDQMDARVRLETEAKLQIQEQVRTKQLELAWSYILDYENSKNPFLERKIAIQDWRDHAVIEIKVSPDLIKKAHALYQKNIKAKDALHVACAIKAKCRYFITTDDVLIRRLAGLSEIGVVNPTSFIVRVIP
ncbi:MAG: PIN domain-containing protein [Verrucomicrobiota bacterium]